MINRKWGNNTIQFAASGVMKKWKMRQEFKSKNFTTRWDELPIALAN